MAERLSLLPLMLAFLISGATIALMLRLGRAGALDEPNHRSLHQRPVPRSGGIGILGAALLGVWASSAPLTLLLGVILLAGVSWLDDQRDLGALPRLLAHLLVATLTLGWQYASAWPFWLFAPVTLVTVWSINLYNFMDGADGLAGGMAAIGFSALGLAAWQADDRSIALLSGCIAAGALGFLPFNLSPARIFMGDVGSIPLGYLAAMIGVLGVHRGHWPVWFPILVFSPFLVDATVTLLRRAARGEKVWQAHREHYYQRLVRMGWSHRLLALAEYTLMLTVAAIAIGLRNARPDAAWPILLAFAVLMCLLMWLVDRRWSLHGVSA